MSYYAVCRGKRPRAYLTCELANVQVKRLPNARQKKFSTQAEAEAFTEKNRDVNAEGNQPRSDQASGQGRVVMPDIRAASPGSILPSRIDPIPEYYYAVARGYRPGVYLMWEEAYAQVKRFSNACQKKFSTRAEAEAFIKENRDVNAEENQPRIRSDQASGQGRVVMPGVRAMTPGSVPPPRIDPIPGYYYAVARGHHPGVYSTREAAYAQVKRFPNAYQKKFKTLKMAEAFIKENGDVSAEENQPRISDYYYAVARGYRPGVYLTWQQASSQVKGFLNACQKKFSTRAEAEAFIKENRDVNAEENQLRSDQASERGRVMMPGVRAMSPGSVPPPRIAGICDYYYAVARAIAGISDDYYAVARGYRPGVYLTWQQAYLQVKGFSNARQKKFSTRAEAEAFIKENRDVSAEENQPRSDQASGQGRVVMPGVRAMSPGSVTPSRIAQISDYYYAVARGYRPGVYLTWQQAYSQVKGFSNARQKKFSTRAEAEAFIQKNRDVSAEGNQQRSDQASGQGHVVMPYVPPPGIDLMRAYYAVAEGRVPGIYATWKEAEVQVQGLQSAKFNKFYTKEEASDFIEDYKKLKHVDPHDPHPRNPSTLVAFCDGSAINNGNSGCRAGWACVFPHNPEWNRAGVLVENRVTGEIPTNNRAEYQGAIEAILRANQEDPSKTRPLYIFTDSKLLVRSMTEWVSTWKQQGWIKVDGSPVLNKDLLKRMLKKQGRRKIIWKHVRAHTNGTDWWSVWNQLADDMAREQTCNRSFRTTSNNAFGRRRS